MEKKFKGWQIALLLAALTLAAFGLSWLAARILPGIRSKEVRFTATCLCLGGVVFRLIFSLLKGPVKEKRWVKGLSLAVDFVYLAALIVYGANLF